MPKKSFKKKFYEKNITNLDASDFTNYDSIYVGTITDSRNKQSFKLVKE